MIRFSNKDELRDRVNPILISKKKELNKKGLECSEEDIWNYFSNEVFPNSKNLELIDVVNDIMNLDINELEEYLNGGSK